MSKDAILVGYTNHQKAIHHQKTAIMYLHDPSTIVTWVGLCMILLSKNKKKYNGNIWC